MHFIIRVYENDFPLMDFTARKSRLQKSKCHQKAHLTSNVLYYITLCLL